jgi:hypothetical protein
MNLNRPRRTALIAGLALIVITNVVALGGAAYNRSGEPDSTLRLSERELRRPYAHAGNNENSGLTLELRWRVAQEAGVGVKGNRFDFEGGGVPAWLDLRKMASLGFDTRPSAQGPVGTYHRQLPRDVLVVLELDGPAFAEAHARALQGAKDVEARNERGGGKKAADDIIEREARSSRLFAVDAGLDHTALRNRYPDRGRYAIVRGQVRPTGMQGNTAGAGYIDNLNAQSVNVPLAWRGALEGVQPETYGLPLREVKHFDATLAFGQRLEPWLVSVVRN